MVRYFLLRKGCTSGTTFVQCQGAGCEPGTNMLRLSLPGSTPEHQGGEELSKYLVNPDVSWVGSV